MKRRCHVSDSAKDYCVLASIPFNTRIIAKGRTMGLKRNFIIAQKVFKRKLITLQILNTISSI